MADWKNVLKAVLLQNGKIASKPAKALKRAILNNGTISGEEFDFLTDLYQSSRKIGSAFQKFYFEVLRERVVHDGTVDHAEADQLRTIFFADNQADKAEQKFLKELKKTATSVVPEFDALLAEATQSLKKKKKSKTETV